MPNDLLKHLNAEQKRAVISSSGPSIILAGAGSGKTRVLTHKVVYLIKKENIFPDNILMLTFTNKAAGEMRKRISSFFSSSENRIFHLPYSGTFHSLSAKILRIEGKAIGIPENYVIYDEGDQKEAVKEAMIETGVDPKKFKASSFAINIQQAKNELISSTQYPEFAYTFFQKEAAKVYLAYQNILRKNHALDFEDLIYFTVMLLKEEETVAKKYQDKFRYILVDEYQDTNHAQYQLTKILSKKHNNICVVGDASQSIYAWRGADFRNILNFKKDYPNCMIFHLEQNYRSSQTILDASFSVISKNTSHPILKLWTDKPSGEKLSLFTARNEHDEADYILQTITKTKYSDPSLKYANFAVLYRTNAQSRIIEEAFLHAGIPYVLVGGTRFYERKEIKDVLSYLRLLSNPDDKISAKRIEKIGKRKYEEFQRLQEVFFKNLGRNKMTTIEILDNILQNTSYLSLYDQSDPEDLVRLENIKELRSVAQEFPVLISFLENVSLVEQEYIPDHPKNDQEKIDAVTLMTLHAAKGLEFDTVFMVGMEEGLFPHSRALLDHTEIEEERRLCYVGMTRAKNKLYLSHTKNRMYFGQRNSNQASRFIEELPEELVVKTDYYSI